MKKFRAYWYGPASTILNCVIAVIAFGFPVLLYWYWFGIAGDISKPPIPIVPLIIFPVLGILFIGYRIYTCSYSLKITDEGKLIETQMFREERLLSRDEVRTITLSYYIYIGIDELSQFLITSPRFINDRYEKFPRYGFSSDLVRQIIDWLKEGNPEITIDEPTKEFLAGKWFPHSNTLMKKQARIANLISVPLLIIYFGFIYWLF